jgi:zinc D-Ala-D-Ala dipeptidase
MRVRPILVRGRPASLSQFQCIGERMKSARTGLTVLLFSVFLLLEAACRKERPDDLVGVRQYAPHVILDIRYATPNNFTHQKVYTVAACLLRRETAEKLGEVEQTLLLRGLTLKIFDCYRPLAVQWKFWKLVPDTRYVADPAKGSRHNRGAAVDLTVADSATGRELDMGTGFDNFTDKAHRDYRDLPAPVLANRRLLEQAMSAHGFIGLPTEWWHFDDVNWERYSLSDGPVL